ncbi:MAG: GNAT family N-acetyltransferase [Pseudomonadota bacterium]
MSTRSKIIIRTPQPNEFQAWSGLWRSYLAFYQTERPTSVYQSTWERFFINGEFEPECRVAELDGELVGLVHFFQHRHCWSVENVVYLQDLFVSQNARGNSVGRQLIGAVYAAADNLGASNVYWMTQDFNDTARALYDRIGEKTPFIKYQR